MDTNDDRPFKAKKDYTVIFIGIMVILLGTIIFFYFQNQNLKTENKQQTAELSETVLRLDSISGELDQKILTISQLGGEVDTLVKIREQLEEEKKLLLTEVDNRKNMISTLQGKVGGYRELLIAKDEEIKELKLMNEELLTENTELKTETQELNKSLKEVNKAKEALAEKVANASRLKLEDLKVFAVSDGGKEREGEFRNRHIDQLKISFALPENEVAPIEGKELLVRILDPEGNVLFDVTRGSGSFMFENREMFYSAREEILYDKKRQEVTVFYDKGSDFIEGLHEVEVYTDDYVMGTGNFLVK